MPIRAAKNNSDEYVDALDVLKGSTVDILRFTMQFVEITFYGGINNEGKHNTLQIEADFSLTLDNEVYTIVPDHKESLFPLLQLLNVRLSDLKLTKDYELTLHFSNGATLTVAPIPKYEAWHVRGDNITFYVAVGI